MNCEHVEICPSCGMKINVVKEDESYVINCEKCGRTYTKCSQCFSKQVRQVWNGYSIVQQACKAFVAYRMQYGN